MPNWEITDNLNSSLRGEVTRLMELRTKSMEQGFPVSQKQLREAIAPEWAREILGTLRSGGFHTVSTTSVVFACIEGDGIERAALVRMTAPTKLYYCYSEQAYYHGSRSNNQFLGERRHLPFDLGVLDETTRAALINWINAAVREHRIRVAVQKLTTDFFKMCPTLAHLNARWPDLKILFTKLQGQWPDRIRDLPRVHLQRWNWPTAGVDYDWWCQNGYRMELASQVIIGASVIDREVESRKTEVTATVEAWQNL